MEDVRRVWEHYLIPTNINQNDLGFSKYTMPLHIMTVIFRKEITTESRSWRKSNFQV